MPAPDAAPPDERWRQAHLGHWLYLAGRRFEERADPGGPQRAGACWRWPTLAAWGQVTAAHLHVTRHLRLDGDRLTDLAQRAGMSKQAMADLVEQCLAWGLVREPDPQGPPRQAHPLHADRTGLAGGLPGRHRTR